jgi:glycosyltransferase involved in cell wall biosynthesis
VDGLTSPTGVTVRFDAPQTVLRAEYHAARSVAIPTLGDRSTAGSDCSGTLVLLDALAMGKPAVITERASVADYVTPGVHVRTVPPEDAGRLADELAWIDREARATAEMARAGQARVRDALTTAHFAERVAGVLHEAAASA